jgi:hypothetical protein
MEEPHRKRKYLALACAVVWGVAASAVWRLLGGAEMAAAILAPTFIAGLIVWIWPGRESWRCQAGLAALWSLTAVMFTILLPFAGWIGWATVLVGWTLAAAPLLGASWLWSRRERLSLSSLVSWPLLSSWLLLLIVSIGTQYAYLLFPNQEYPSQLQPAVVGLVWLLMAGEAVFVAVVTYRMTRHHWMRARSGAQLAA